MIVNLAGFNVDIENIKILNEFLNKYPDIKIDDIEKIKKLNWTPETISASYARISRDPRAIEELRKEASSEVEKARKSNKAIIFDMGHSSISEHGVFNIDIIGISRFVAETLEKSRLASFTEKSQRYVKIGFDTLYPEEFTKDEKILSRYKLICNELFNSYNMLHDRILPYFLHKNPNLTSNDKGYKDLVNLAKEDARYILPLATLTQVGMTINSRSLEKLIRKLIASDIIESQMLGREIFRVIEGYAPSLVKYTSPTNYETKTYSDIKAELSNLNITSTNNEVELVEIDEDIETKVLASFVVKNTSCDYGNAKREVGNWDNDQKTKIYKQAIKYLQSYDAVLREFEMSEIVFNIVISATAYAQLKRHRMATIIDGEYNPCLGIKIPDSINETGQKEFFLSKIKIIEDFYNDIKKQYPTASNYILSNAHRKNVIFKCNLRELVHFSRLRSDNHAQWDIRNISDQVISLASAKLPLFSNLLCGKDNFKSLDFK